jgi:quinol monooxygenase YgiN
MLEPLLVASFCGRLIMFIVVCTYRARTGEEDAVVALHEDWQRTLRARAAGYLSGELLHSARDPQAFTTIARYEDEASAQAVAADAEYVAWQRRLLSLTDAEPTHVAYYRVWCDPGGLDEESGLRC